MAIMQWLVGKRHDNAIEQLGKIMRCARKAGIYHAISPGFGTMLGIVMHFRLLPNDTDLDVIIERDKITKAQEDAYFHEIKEAGLFKDKDAGYTDAFRGKGPTRDGNGRLLWFSLGEKDIMKDNGVKCCNWFSFTHNKFLWHTKGRGWLKKISEPKYGAKPGDAAIAKGCPYRYYGEKVQIDFFGVQLNMPQYAGALCDYLYGGWHLERKGGQSAKRAILNIKDWKNPNKWVVRLV
jgi:hypothetical protein